MKFVVKIIYFYKYLIFERILKKICLYAVGMCLLQTFVRTFQWMNVIGLLFSICFFIQ